MKNLEKYFDELIDNGHDSDMVCYWLEVMTRRNCGERSCKQCRIEFLKWLNEEYKEKPKLTDDEKAILRNIEPKFKFIARDKNRVLFIYMIKPYKDKVRWESDATFMSLDIFGHLFQSIKWEDEEPYNIEELLKEVE